MKRKIYNKLLEWKNQWQGKSALLIDGARRVGKSWIAEEFAKNEYRTHIIIDFNDVRSEILDIFNNHLFDLDQFFSLLSFTTGVQLYPRESIIVFDEVQLFPQARAALKYLVADGRYDFIETGSLVSINHNVKDIMIPSEEVRIEMHPMDFEEFLWALDMGNRFEYVRERFSQRKPLEASAHRIMIELLRTYMLVGGMPQGVLEYVESRNFRIVDEIKRNIINLYSNDISKYAGRQVANVRAVFDNIPGALGKHARRFRPSAIKKGARMRTFTEAMFWLDESRVVNFCYGVNEPSVGFNLTKEDGKVKIYMADTGLLVSMIFPVGHDTDEIYRKIMLGKLEFNKGMIVENLVAQQLRSNGHPLFFFSTSSREDANDTMEIDFLIQKPKITSRHNVIPIEVKSTNRYSISSLEKFRRKFERNVDQPIVLHTGELKEADGILYLPLYMAAFL